jgi:hypothetical protein
MVSVASPPRVCDRALRRRDYAFGRSRPRGGSKAETAASPDRSRQPGDMGDPREAVLDVVPSRVRGEATGQGNERPGANASARRSQIERHKTSLRRTIMKADYAPSDRTGGAREIRGHDGSKARSNCQVADDVNIPYRVMPTHRTLVRPRSATDTPRTGKLRPGGQIVVLVMTAKDPRSGGDECRWRYRHRDRFGKATVTKVVPCSFESRADRVGRGPSHPDLSRPNWPSGPDARSDPPRVDDRQGHGHTALRDRGPKQAMLGRHAREAPP